MLSFSNPERAGSVEVEKAAEILDYSRELPRFKSLKGYLWGYNVGSNRRICRKTLDFIGGRCRFRTCDPRLVRSNV